VPGTAELEAAYGARLPILTTTAQYLQHRVTEALESTKHIDRVSFRPKGMDSFVKKASREATERHDAYERPLVEVEDQIAGRVLVFFRDDIDVVAAILSAELGPVEQRRQEPDGDDQFGYESVHLIFVIPEHLKADGWTQQSDMPITFELQVRTLFMHAWAEPQHDLGYKPGATLDRDHRRQLAWVAASAWGADRVLNDVKNALAAI
jgi:putative GTP pyrophosphokinase